MMKRRIATAITVVPYMKIVVTITKLYVMISRKPGNFDCLHMKLREGNIFSHVSVPVSHSVEGGRGGLGAPISLYRERPLH